MAINKKIYSEFKGLHTIIKDPKELPEGTPQDSLNWLPGSKGDHIELRMGYKLLGKTSVAGVGKVTGLKVGVTEAGVEVPFFTCGQSIKYYDSVSDDTAEISQANILPLAANGEDVAIEHYVSLAGSFIYVASPNSSIYKIHIAYPSLALDQVADSKGYIKIKQNRTFMWNNFINSTKFWDKTGLTNSYIDKSVYSLFTAVTGEAVGTGDGATVTYSGYLVERKNKRTVFNVVVKGGGGVSTISVSFGGHNYTVNDVITITGGDGNCTIKVDSIGSAGEIQTISITAAGTGYTTGSSNYGTGGTGNGAIFNITAVTTGGTFIDNKNGGLVGSDGGTGTINYTTGAYSVTFGTAPAISQAITASYLWEDATSGGILDFSSSSPRTKGQGNYYNQNDGGGMFMNLFAIGGDLICLHQLKSWDLILGINDTTSSNTPYRDKVNIPYWRAGDETDDGVLAFFRGDQNFPQLAILSYGQYTTTIVPTPLSDEMDFTPYGTDYTAVKRWGNYDVLCLQNQTNGVNDQANNIMLVRNITSGEYAKLDYRASVLDSYNGNLIAGDSSSNNVFVLFSGYDDSGDLINNYWISGMIDFEIDGIKKFTDYYIDGFIAKDQQIAVYLQYDNGGFIEVGSSDDLDGTHHYAIEGTGAYVDLSAGTIVGSDTVGVQVVGGGSIPNAYHFTRQFRVATPLFSSYVVKFQAMSIGAVQINEHGAIDIRYKGGKSIPSYVK